MKKIKWKLNGERSENERMKCVVVHSIEMIKRPNKNAKSNVRAVLCELN